MDFDKFLLEDSPLVGIPKHETLNAMLDAIFNKNEFPQDAIEGEMLHEALMVFPKLEIRSIKAFRISPQDFGDIFAGYTLALMAVNVAISARSNGDVSTLEYVKRFENPVERNYFLNHLAQLKQSIIQDHTSANIFEYASKNPPKSGFFYLLGIELARINFGVYGLSVMNSMNEKYGGIQTMRIWMGMG